MGLTSTWAITQTVPALMAQELHHSFEDQTPLITQKGSLTAPSLSAGKSY